MIKEKKMDDTPHTKQTEYEFKALYDKKSGQGIGVKLEDGTIVMADMKSQGLRIAYPKKKFTKLFKKQMDNKKTKYIEVVFSKHEIDALMKSLKFRK